MQALVLDPWCGDCEIENYYLAGERYRVRVGIDYGIHIPGDREALGTFARWKAEP